MIVIQHLTEFDSHMILNNILDIQNEDEPEQNKDRKSSEETYVDKQVLHVWIQIRSKHSGFDPKFDLWKYFCLSI